jgi:hypothetical protein
MSVIAGRGTGGMEFATSARAWPGCGDARGCTTMAAMRASTPSPSPTVAAACSRCGAPFRCGRHDAEPCWCAALPALDPAQYAEAAGCLCEACLRALVERREVPQPPVAP